MAELVEGHGLNIVFLQDTNEPRVYRFPTFRDDISFPALPRIRTLDKRHNAVEEGFESSGSECASCGRAEPDATKRRRGARIKSCHLDQENAPLSDGQGCVLQ